MQVLGHVKNGTIVLDEPEILPEGAKVKISFIPVPAEKLAGSLSKYAEGKPFPTEEQIAMSLAKGLINDHHSH